MDPSRRLFFISLGAVDFVTYDQREVFFPTLFCQANVIILPNFIPRGGLALPDFRGLFEKSSFKMADSQRLVRVKTRMKAFFFEEIFINIPSKNLPKLSKERTQYFCHALKLNLRSRHSHTRRKSKHCSMNRSLEPKMTYKFSTALDPLFNSTGF